MSDHSTVDCRYIATSPVNNIEVLTSRNFKHIINLNKIRLYNAINVQEGFRNIEIKVTKRNSRFMKNNIKTKKTFDAVDLMRSIREKIK